jgi:uncharacterized protein YqhQ
MSTPTYGGQAVIEGVMMRGPSRYAVACRRPDGVIEIKSSELPGRIYTSKFWAKPFLRGLVLLAETLHLGTAQLRWSANLQLEGKTGKTFSSRAMLVTTLFSVTMTIVIFLLLPHWLSALAGHSTSLAPAWFETPLRLGIALGYLTAISRLPNVQVLWRYHGGEHKSINALEAGLPLTITAIRPMSLHHPRCGTGFFVLVLIIASLAFLALTPLHLPFLAGVAARILIAPLVVTTSYELMRWLAAHRAMPGASSLLALMLSAQRLTTAEPTDAQLECAIAALSAVLEPAERAQAAPIALPALSVA